MFKKCKEESCNTCSLRPQLAEYSKLVKISYVCFYCSGASGEELANDDAIKEFVKQHAIV